jgi:DNA-binding transcriptional LysR family regulator
MYFDLNLKHLKVFYYVAKHLSFTRAAQELFVTQPAVAMQIDALEKHYGVRFFTRRKRQLALTEAGEALFEYAERIMQLAFEAHRTILDMKEYPCGVLKLGTTKTWARYLMPSYILQFQKRFPEIQIELQDGSSEDMAMSVIYGQNDMAIVARVPYDPRLEVIPFPGREKDELVLVVHPKHRLARRKRISLREIVEEPLIIRGRGSGIREVVMHRAEDLGLTLNIMLEAGSVDFIKAMVMQGAGVTILTTISVEEYVRNGTLKAVHLAEPAMWLDVDLVVRKEGYRPFAVRSFLDFLLESNGQTAPDQEPDLSAEEPLTVGAGSTLARRRGHLAE